MSESEDAVPDFSHRLAEGLSLAPHVALRMAGRANACQHAIMKLVVTEWIRDWCHPWEQTIAPMIVDLGEQSSVVHLTHALSRQPGTGR